MVFKIFLIFIYNFPQLSPIPFNTFPEETIKEVNEKRKAGITVHGKRIKMIRSANDIGKKVNKTSKIIFQRMEWILIPNENEPKVKLK